MYKQATSKDLCINKLVKIYIFIFLKKDRLHYMEIGYYIYAQKYLPLTKNKTKDINALFN